MSSITITNPATVFAQTFFVDPVQTPNGIYVTKVNIPFQTVDPSLPVSLELRPTTNGGYPDLENAFPGSEVILSPDLIVLQTTTGVNGDYPSFDDANTYTTFTFPAPVYLPTGQHAIVLKTASTNYQVYVAIQGDNVLGTLNSVNNPPFIGSLFLPTNASTWVPVTNKALMFRLWRSDFDTSDTSIVEFDVNAPANTNTYFDLFSVSSNDFNIGSTKTDYGYLSTDGSGNIDSTQSPLTMNRNYYPTTVRRIINNGDFKAFATLRSSSPFISPIVDTTRLSMVAIKYFINNGELSNNLINITSGGAGYNALTTSVTIDAPVGSGGTTANATANVTAAGAIDKILLNNLGSKYYITPNISITGVGTGATANCIGETSASGGNALYRYISRRVTLATGFNASDLKLFMTACRQSATDIEVYFKVQNINDPDQNFPNKLWQRMTLVGNSAYFSQNNQDFVEYTFVSPQSLLVPAKSINYVNNGVTYSGFNIFAIKICGFTSQRNIVPVINNIRAVAFS